MASRLRWQRPERLYDLLAPLARLVVWLLADLRVVGAERVPAHGGVLLAANHVSFLDPLVLAVALYDCGRRKVRFVALADLFDHPLVGWVLRGTRMIPVARGRGVERMAEEACAALEAGQAVLVYPDGTIVPPGQTRPARPGAGLVALRARVPVLPIASQGAERRRRRGLPRLRRRVTVALGAPWTCRAGMGGWTDRRSWRPARPCWPACRHCATTRRVADGQGRLVVGVRSRAARAGQAGPPGRRSASPRWPDRDRCRS